MLSTSPLAIIPQVDNAMAKLRSVRPSLRSRLKRTVLRGLMLSAVLGVGTFGGLVHDRMTNPLYAPISFQDAVVEVALNMLGRLAKPGLVPNAAVPSVVASDDGPARLWKVLDVEAHRSPMITIEHVSTPHPEDFFNLHWTCHAFVPPQVLIFGMSCSTARSSPRYARPRS